MSGRRTGRAGPTVYDVAERAGVSTATVSFAFSRPERVKATTLKTVLEAAAGLGYVPNADARGLARGATSAIGFYAFDYLQDDAIDTGSAPGHLPTGARFPLYADEVQRGVQLACRARGIALLIGSGSAEESDRHMFDVAGRVDGLIAFAGTASKEDLHNVATRIPVIQLGQTAAGSALPTVPVDGGSAMARLVQHLLQVHGFRRFHYVGGLRRPDLQERYTAFAAELEAAGLQSPPPDGSHPGEDRLTAAAVRIALEEPHPPDVFVCSTDQEALLTLHVLRSRGIDVPRDVAVTGFDGILAAHASRPRLTTVRQPMESIGRRAVDALVNLIAGSDGVEPEALPCTVLIGQSCGCVV